MVSHTAIYNNLTKLRSDEIQLLAALIQCRFAHSAHVPPLLFGITSLPFGEPETHFGREVVVFFYLPIACVTLN